MEQVMLMTKSNRGFFGDVTQRLRIQSRQFFLTQSGFHPYPPHLQVQEDLIKTESVMLMTKSN